MSIDDEEREKDPFLILGSGLISYRDLIFASTCVFLVFTLLVCPLFYIYAKYDNMLEPLKFANLSIGKLGYSSAQCVTIQLGMQKFPMTCPYGKIGEIHSIGATPDD